MFEVLFHIQIGDCFSTDGAIKKQQIPLHITGNILYI